MLDPIAIKQWWPNYYKTDAKYADNTYTKFHFGYPWRKLKIGKFKDKDVKWVCYCFPMYIKWCLENWKNFKLTYNEQFDLVKSLKNRLEKDPDNQELKEFLEYHETLCTNTKGYGLRK